jgi:hypothetical protein
MILTCSKIFHDGTEKSFRNLILIEFISIIYEQIHAIYSWSINSDWSI